MILYTELHTIELKDGGIAGSFLYKNIFYKVCRLFEFSQIYQWVTFYWYTLSYIKLVVAFWISGAGTSKALCYIDGGRQIWNENNKKYKVEY